jgi:hypothetical protein
MSSHCCGWWAGSAIKVKIKKKKEKKKKEKKGSRGEGDGELGIIITNNSAMSIITSGKIKQYSSYLRTGMQIVQGCDPAVGFQQISVLT